MHYQVIETLKKALVEQPDTGICGLLEKLELEEAQFYYELMFKACEDLGVFSGTLAMPISVQHGEPYMLYRSAKRKGKLWKSTTRYGAARRKVALRMIEEIENADRRARECT